eukprot:TRINITY_DN25133_c0_g1_i1.p1 TRINITY_DN25133_c0_g1~~TRINITY_DN25133_c0_g1_i1.p1  ORF type:complete len:115 (+),score=21.07 TRINITY_DN25133_c0_g1_i1:220-564(+)
MPLFGLEVLTPLSPIREVAEGSATTPAREDACEDAASSSAVGVTSMDSRSGARRRDCYLAGRPNTQDQSAPAGNGTGSHGLLFGGGASASSSAPASTKTTREKYWELRQRFLAK